MKLIITLFTYLAINNLAIAQGKIDIFLVRGLIRSLEYSQANNDILEQKLQEKLGKELILHSYELAGNGRLFEETSHTSIKEMVESLRLQYKKKKREGSNAYMIAISLGGMIGINWLDMYPEDYEKGFIFNSSLPKFCGIFERLLPKSIPTLLSGAISSDPIYKEQQIHKIIINHLDRNKDLWKKWSEVSKQMPVSFPNTIRQLWAALWSPNPDKVSTPLFIGVSEKDRMVSSECSKRMAKAWNVPLFIHPTAGHDILNDDPEWMAEKIAEHIKL